jgi:hypothetical protein
MENWEEKANEFQLREYMYAAQVAALGREVDLHRAGKPPAEPSASLTGAFSDPVINMEICALRQIIADKDQEIEKLREELAAATFDPNAMAGLKLMKKMKKILEENQDLGKQLVEDKALGAAAALAKEKELHAATQEELRESTEFSSILDEENEKLQVQIQELTKKLAEVKKQQAEDGAGQKRARTD